MDRQDGQDGRNLKSIVSNLRFKILNRYLLFILSILSIHVNFSGLSFAQTLARADAHAVDEVPRLHALFAFGLQLEDAKPGYATAGHH